MMHSKLYFLLIVLFILSCETQNNENDWRKSYSAALKSPENYIHDSHYLIRSRSLLSANIDKKNLEKLAKDPSWYVRSKVALHKNTSLQALQLLASDPQIQVRKAVASNDNATPEILQLLAKDAHWQVRFAILNHKNVPVDILHKWSTSESHFTRKELNFHLANNANTFKRFSQFLHHKKSHALYTKISEEIAQYSCTQSQILEILSQHDEWEIRLLVAQNPKASPKCLQTLAKDEDESVRSEVINNPSISIALLKNMIASEESEDLQEEAQEILEEKLAEEED